MPSGEAVNARGPAFWKRTRQFLREGHDRFAAARLVVEAAGGRIVVSDSTAERLARVARARCPEGNPHVRSVLTADTARALLAGVGRRRGGEARGQFQHVAWLHNEC